ncbi:MAG: TM2 domain-containing protein [Candidatus Kapabacteria bacterium]|jgi:TM2 domain-containing membrane protein YozV|nr:TM2 domain-containing protein [Candidatus Kapabacteria bacterium]
MEQSKVDLFISTMNEKFAPANMPAIRQHLMTLDDGSLINLQSMNFKNPTTILIVSLLAGTLGVDRFMMGQTGLGVAKLLTCGGFLIWAIVDLFLVMGKTRELNYQMLMQQTAGMAEHTD